MDPSIESELFLVADLIATMPTAGEMVTSLLAAVVDLERLLFASPSLWRMLQARLEVLSRLARAGEGDARTQYQLVLRQLLDRCGQATDRRTIFHLRTMAETLVLKWIGSECANMNDEPQLLDRLAGGTWLDELHQRHRIHAHAARERGINAFQAISTRYFGGNAGSSEPRRAGLTPWFELALENLARLAELHAGYRWFSVGARLAVRRELGGADDHGSSDVITTEGIVGEADDPASYQVAMGCWLAWNLLASAYDSLLPSPRRVVLRAVRA